MYPLLTDAIVYRPDLNKNIYSRPSVKKWSIINRIFKYCIIFLIKQLDLTTLIDYFMNKKGV